MRKGGNMRGFTLVEVLVALVIFALAIGAMITAQGNSLSGLAALDDRLYGEIVAENQLVEEMTAARRLTSGFTYGEADMAGRTFYWTQQIRPTGRGNIMWIDVQVRTTEDRDAQVIASLSGFREAAP